MQRGRLVMKLLQIHHRHEQELRRIKSDRARRVADEASRVVAGSALDSSTQNDSSLEAAPDLSDIGAAEWPALEAAARVSRLLPPKLIQAITGKLPPALSEEFLASVYSFDGIPSLEPRVIQAVIRNSEKRTLAIALLGAPDEVFFAITRNMSSRAGRMLQEDMESLLAAGELKTRDVHEARHAISSAIRTRLTSKE
jgi:hypothetical protein